MVVSPCPQFSAIWTSWTYRFISLAKFEKWSEINYFNIFSVLPSFSSPSETLTAWIWIFWCCRTDPEALFYFQCFFKNIFQIDNFYWLPWCLFTLLSIAYCAIESIQWGFVLDLVFFSFRLFIWFIFITSVSLVTLCFSVDSQRVCPSCGVLMTAALKTPSNNSNTYGTWVLVPFLMWIDILPVVCIP